MTRTHRVLGLTLAAALWASARAPQAWALAETETGWSPAKWTAFAALVAAAATVFLCILTVAVVVYAKRQIDEAARARQLQQMEEFSRRWASDPIRQARRIAATHNDPDRFSRYYIEQEANSTEDFFVLAELDENWWRHVEPRPAMRESLLCLDRFCSTVRVSKHRLFSWLSRPTLPDSQVFAYARSDDYFFGVLHSRLHEIWARAQGTQVRERESGFRYTPTTCFETFPFPWNVAEEPEAADPLVEAIAEAARELNELRENWLNPSEWTREQVLEFPGSTDGPWKRYVHEPDDRGIGTVHWPRIVPRNDDCAEKLKRRTLTNLYNDRPTWLDLAHRKLDEAVFAAYGWSPEMSDEEILGKLLALDLERAAAESQACAGCQASASFLRLTCREGRPEILLQK